MDVQVQQKSGVKKRKKERASMVRVEPRKRFFLSSTVRRIYARAAVLTQLARCVCFTQPETTLQDLQ